MKTPTIVSNSIYQFNDQTSIKASNIVLPNNYLNLSDKELVILVDNNTACGSEIFTSVLKNHADAIVIGNERTSGSYSSEETFILPFGITFQTNIITKFSPVGNEANIEFTGIEPNIYVPFYSYKDLYPYDDKILETGLKFKK